MMRKCVLAIVVCVLVLTGTWLMLNEETQGTVSETVIGWLPSPVVAFVWGPEAVLTAPGFEVTVDEHAVDDFSGSEQEEDQTPDTSPDLEFPENQKGDESGEADATEPEETGPVVFDENPRYTLALDPVLGEVLRSEVQQGDTAGKILGTWFNADEVAAIVAAARPLCPLTSIHLGRPFAVARDPESKVPSLFKYEMDKKQRLMVERQDGRFVARLEKIEYNTRLELIRGRLVSNLINAVTEQGEGVGFAIALANVFGSEINFITDPREGDTFEVLVEKQYRHDTFSEYGRIVAARYLNDGKTHEAYLFRDTQGRTAYYNAKGESLHRALLKAPLSFLRVTSKYSMARRHPVSGNVRPHQGIDYGAASGTPIMAVGHGTVTLAGRAGGYGNQVIIKHGNGLESLYGHMSRFAKGISKGKTVRQGQTIGYVGSTGVATGPHLDFRIKQRGKFVNPTKLVVPRDPGVPSRSMGAFKTVIKRVDSFWNGGTPLAEYDGDTILD